MVLLGRTIPFFFFERTLCAQSRLSGIAVGFLGFEVEEK